MEEEAIEMDSRGDRVLYGEMEERGDRGVCGGTADLPDMLSDKTGRALISGGRAEKSCY